MPGQAAQAVHPPEPAQRLDAVLIEARGLLASGREDEAITRLRTAQPTARADQVRVLALMADAHRLAGRPEEARGAYTEAIATAGAGARPEHLADLATLLEDDLRNPSEASRVWERYLREHPRGEQAQRALWRLLLEHERAGRGEAAAASQDRLLREFPRSSEATQALVHRGRALLDGEQWDAAAALFQSHAGASSPARAEAALVGLIRARVGQGRMVDARALAEHYTERFPTGARRSEVEHVLAALRGRTEPD